MLYWLPFTSSPFCFFPLSPSLPGSSDEDEDDDGVTAAAFLKKKSEAPSGESRKFLKKEVRARVTLRGGLLALDHAWVSREKNRLMGLELGRVGISRVWSQNRYPFRLEHRVTGIRRTRFWSQLCLWGALCSGASHHFSVGLGGPVQLLMS